MNQQLSSSHYDGLLRCFLENTDIVADYLNNALEEGQESFFLALKDVIDVCGGPALFSQKTGLNRFSVNGMFSGKPTMESTTEVLKALKLKLLDNRVILCETK